MRAYLKDPEEIYRRSFEIVRAETDLSGLDADEAEVAVRLVHASGMPEIAPDLRFAPGAVAAAVAALAAGAPILADAAMVAHGVTRRLLPAGNRIVSLIGDERAGDIAKREGTTRSAAQVRLWLPELAGAVVAIGNAPTALYRLLDEIEAGAPRPAVVLGFPVGFVGAAESKQELVAFRPTVPYLTLLGRRGGSAMAAAAVNALAILAGGGGGRT